MPINAHRIKYAGLEKVREGLNQKIVELIQTICPDAVLQGNSGFVMARITGGKGNSFFIPISGKYLGLWFENNPKEAKGSGDLFDLIGATQNLHSFKERLRWASNWLGNDVFIPYEVKTSFSKDEKEKRALQPAEFATLSERHARLKNNPEALNYLYRRGLTDETINQFMLGIRKPYKSSDGQETSNALSVPTLGSDGVFRAHYFNYNIPGITINPISDNGWGLGPPQSCWDGVKKNKSLLVVMEGHKDLWRVAQAIKGTELEGEVALLTSTHGSAIPDEWKTPSFWRPYQRVFLAHDIDSAGNSLAEKIAVLACREVLRLPPPIPLEKIRTEVGNNGEPRCKDYTDYFQLCGGTYEGFKSALEGAKPIDRIKKAERHNSSSNLEVCTGFKPVNINNSFIEDPVTGKCFMYYPYQYVRCMYSAENNGFVDMAQREVQVLRSDGKVLRIYKPESIVKKGQRVLMLTDGTQIVNEPTPDGTWQYDKILEYVNAKQSNRPVRYRPLVKLIWDLISFFKGETKLPYDDEYTVCALFSGITYIFDIFSAVPYLYLNGAKNTGKSRTTEAISSVSCNASLLTNKTIAGAALDMDTCRGVICIDDVEALRKPENRRSQMDEEFLTMLLTGYKKLTAMRTIVGSDFHGSKKIKLKQNLYCPKVINNIYGMEPTLLSRCLIIKTYGYPVLQIRKSQVDPEKLRQELHAWGMDNGPAIYVRWKDLIQKPINREKEILRPLWILAQETGDPQIIKNLDAFARRQAAMNVPLKMDIDSIVPHALKNCIRKSFDPNFRISLVQLMLEIQMCVDPNAGKESAWQNPQWNDPVKVGKKLEEMGIFELDKDSENQGTHLIKHNRLFSCGTTIYQFREEYIKAALTRKVKTIDTEKSECLFDVSQKRNAALQAKIAKKYQDYKVNPNEPTPILPEMAFSFCERMECANCLYSPACAKIYKDNIYKAKSDQIKSIRNSIPGKGKSNSLRRYCAWKIVEQSQRYEEEDKDE